MSLGYSGAKWSVMIPPPGGIMRIFSLFMLITSVVPLMSVNAQEAAQSQATPTTRLDLICVGGGAANKATQSTANAWGNDGEMTSLNVAGRQSVGFEDQVKLWVEGDDGRIRMPRAMLPPIRGGEDGWFKLKSIKMSDSEIVGSIAVNPLNSPKLRIDRLTGAISISGKAGDFTGRCEKYDPATTQRAF